MQGGGGGRAVRGVSKCRLQIAGHTRSVEQKGGGGKVTRPVSMTGCRLLAYTWGSGAGWRRQGRKRS